MKPEQQELFRVAILRVLEANPTRRGLPLRGIGLMLSQFGFPNPAETDLADALDYLERRDPPLIDQPLKIISKENRAWRITGAGVAFLDSQ
jgi:hypothetical protein